MKKREGFVSNSSSSSFIIGVKNGKKLTEKKLLEVLGVPEKSPMYSLAKGAAKVLVSNSKGYSSKEEYISDEDNYCSDESEIPSDVKKLLNKGMTVYCGSVPDFGDGGNEMEAAVCGMRLKYSDDEIVINKDDSY